MTRFVELFRHITPPPPGKIYADERPELFPSAVARSDRFALWSRDHGIPTTGAFLLVGAATWSGYDMQLLDRIEQALAERPGVRVGVFDMNTVQSQEEFESIFPGVGDVHHPPVVGYWVDGVLVDKECGYLGREIVARVLGIDTAVIHQPAPRPA